MRLFKLLVLITVLVVMLQMQAGAVGICKNGRAQACIVVGSDCIAPEKTAAKELAKYLKMITGADYRVYKDTDKLPAKLSKIYVGRSKVSDKLLKGVDWQVLARDGIAIKTVGADLVLSGGRPRGTLYAVYTFLEDYLGCRWWTSIYEVIPKKKNIAFAKLYKVYSPRMVYRESHYRQSYDTKRPDFAIKLKLDGVMQETPPEWGGHEFFINGGHSFGRLISADVYFKDHPEWFSEIDGRRIPDGQLCLSNKEMRKEMIKNVLATVAAYPDARIVDVSQNDNYSYCKCPECTAIAAKYGGQSGLLIDFINEIAAEVHKKYPNHLVQTFAYQYTRFAPKDIVPADNVVIRLCNIESECSKPLTSSTNADFYKALNEWNRISKRMFIWDYVANFSNYHIPHPNTQILAKNIKLYVKAGAIGMFEQGDMYNNTVCFSELRNWVTSKLLWDSRLDGDKLMNEFMTAYYGKAADSMKSILNVYTDSVLRANFKLSCYKVNNPYFTADDYIKAFRLFNKALSLADSAQIRDRILTQRKGLELSLLLTSLKIRKEVYDSGVFKIEDPAAWCKAYMDWTSKTDNTFISEGQPITLQYFRSKMIYRDPQVSIPDKCKGLKEQDWFDVQDSYFFLTGEGNWAFRIQDAKASDNSAVRMPLNHTQWATAFSLTPVADYEITRGEVFIRVRKENDSPASFTAGIYNSPQGKSLATASFSADDVTTEYKDFSLGVQPIGESGLNLWIAPDNLGNGNSIYIDRVYIIKR